MKEWDPIGVCDIPEAKDEYDSYVPPHIYSQLIHRRTENEIFENLWKIENENMGLFGNGQRTENVTKLLLKLREKMEYFC